MTAFLRLGTLGSALALRLGAIENSEIMNKKHNSVKNVVPVDFKKDICLYYELKQNGRAWPFSSSGGNVHKGQFKFFAALHMALNDRESATNIDFGVTHIY